MMQGRYGMTAVLVLCCTTLSMAAQNQTPTAPPAAAKPAAPKLDALDQQALQFDADGEKAARAACDEQAAAQSFRKYRALLDAQIKAKYPGFALNWQTKQLGPVEAAKK